MRWDVIHAAFQDELEKIAEFNMMGLSPQQALGTPAPPMETTGLQQAMNILSRVERPEEKVAAARRPRAAQEMGSVEMPGVSQATGSNGGLGNQGRNAAWSTLGGASAGRLAVDAFHPNTPKDMVRGGKTLLGKEILHNRRWHGLVGGAAAGVSIYAGRKLYQRQQAKKQKTSAVGAIVSPKMALKASQQTAKPRVTGPKTGPNLSSKSSGSTIGSSFRIKG